MSSAVVAGLATFGAYAYWTASGTGSGTATVGTDSGVRIVVDNIGAALYPGGSATVTFHVHNDSTTTAVTVAKVVQDGPVTDLPVGCLAADFSFGDVTLNESVAANSDGRITRARSRWPTRQRIRTRARARAPSASEDGRRPRSGRLSVGGARRLAPPTGRREEYQRGDEGFDEPGRAGQQGAKGHVAADPASPVRGSARPRSLDCDGCGGATDTGDQPDRSAEGRDEPEVRALQVQRSTAGDVRMRTRRAAVHHLRRERRRLQELPGTSPLGQHTFKVRSALGHRTSPAATYSWFIVRSSGQTPSPAPGQPSGSSGGGQSSGSGSGGSSGGGGSSSGQGSSGGSGGQGSSASGGGSSGGGSSPGAPASHRGQPPPLHLLRLLQASRAACRSQISGSVSGLVPGATKVIPLTLANPNVGPHPRHDE